MGTCISCPISRDCYGANALERRAGAAAGRSPTSLPSPSPAPPPQAQHPLPPSPLHSQHHDQPLPPPAQRTHLRQLQVHRHKIVPRIVSRRVGPKLEVAHARALAGDAVVSPGEVDHVRLHPFDLRMQGGRSSKAGTACGASRCRRGATLRDRCPSGPCNGRCEGTASQADCRCSISDAARAATHAALHCTAAAHPRRTLCRCCRKRVCAFMARLQQQGSGGREEASATGKGSADNTPAGSTRVCMTVRCAFMARVQQQQGVARHQRVVLTSLDTGESRQRALCWKTHLQRSSPGCLLGSKTLKRNRPPGSLHGSCAAAPPPGGQDAHPQPLPPHGMHPRVLGVRRRGALPHQVVGTHLRVGWGGVGGGLLMSGEARPGSLRHRRWGRPASGCTRTPPGGEGGEGQAGASAALCLQWSGRQADRRNTWVHGSSPRFPPSLPQVNPIRARLVVVWALIKVAPPGVRPGGGAVARTH